MSVINGFFIIVMLSLLAYTGYRLFLRRKLTMLLTVCGQIFAISIALLSFVNNIQAPDLIQICFLFFGIFIPCNYLIYDYVKMMKKVKDNGVFEGLVEQLHMEKVEERKTGLSIGKINPILKEKPVVDVVKDLDLNKEDVIKNIRKSLNHAQSYLSKKDYNNAFDIYNTIIKIIDNCSGLFFNHGNICYRLGNYSDAVNSYKKVIELDAEYAVHYNMGNALYKLKNFEKAVQFYEKALELNPALLDAQENVVLSMVGMGESEKAIEYFKKVAGQEEKNYRVHYILSRLFFDSGKFEEAEEEIGKYIKTDPACAAAFEEYGRILVKQNKLSKAIEAFDNFIRLKPDDHTGYYYKGSCYYKLGMKKEAVDCYKKSVEMKPDNYKGYYNMAVALDEMGSKNEALESFSKTIELKPDFIDAYNNLGVLLSTIGKNNEALEIYQEGIRRNPEEYSLYLNMGITLSEVGRYREAVTAFRNVLELKPDENETNYYLGAALTELRNYNDAIDAYKKALKIKPSDSELFYNIATVYSLLGKYDIAKDNLKKAIEINESFKNDARTNRAFDGMRGKNDFRELVS